MSHKNPAELPNVQERTPTPAEWERGVRTFFSDLKQSQQVRDIEIDGVKLRVLPDVFSPEVFFESAWFARKIAEIAQQKSLLEIGPGSGIIGVFAALRGANVTAIDINEKAVENTRLNFEMNQQRVRALVGSVYEPLSKEDTFDIIFWNHPFNKSNQEEEDVLLRSVFDYQYRDLETYISGAKSHLKPGGRLLLGSSSIADLTEIARLADSYGYEFELVHKVDRESEVEGVKTDFRIYQFSEK